MHESALSIAGDVKKGARTARGVLAEARERMARSDRAVQAFLEVTSAHAEQVAERVDRAVDEGRPPGPLAGAPIAVKDTICTAFGRTTCGSRMLEQHRSPFSATAIERIEAAGGVIVGKTNCDEFAMGSSNENSAFFPTRNPWDSTRVPGGSSGGSAAALAAGMVPLALGSDTGGSIRQPAAFCGVVGVKPTYGRVSRYGLVAFGSSLDQIGPLARNVTDAALLLGVISGHDPRDSTSVAQPTPDYVGAVRDDALDGYAANLRIGVPAEWLADGLDDEVRAALEAALEVYRGLGARTIEVSLPHSRYGVAAYYVIATAECSSNLARFDGVHYGARAYDGDDIAELYSASRAAGFGAEVKRRVMLGTYALSSGYYDAYYDKALRVRRLIQRDFEAAFEQADVLACPTTPTPAFRLGEKVDDPLQMYLADVYTIPANLAGIPAISLPCGFSAAGLPIGLQLLGPLFSEAVLLQVARLHERETDWHDRVAPAAPPRV